MKRKRYLIGGLIVVVLLVFVFTYHRYTDFSPNPNEIAEYENLNERLTLTKDVGFVDSELKLKDSSAAAIFEQLRDQGRLIYVEKDENLWIIYKIKHEKVRPISGIGLNYFSHYFMHTGNGEHDFEKYFTSSYNEEKYIKSKKIKDGWYYVIGEHFSD
jgi:hypothetical protein